MSLLTVSFQQIAKFKILPHRNTLAKWMTSALEKDAEITVRFVDAQEGRFLNKTYRDKDYATNVLTFDYAKAPIVTADIVICIPVLLKEARDQQKTFKEHLAHLLIHGVLHAHGYDHLNEEEAIIMEARETEILVALGFDQPYSDEQGRVHQ